MSDLSLLYRQLAHWNAHGEIPMSDGREHVVSENPFSVTLRRASVKGGPQIVRVESLLEYDFFCVLDFDNRVEKYKEQAIVIPWRNEKGQYRRYTPDVLVKFKVPSMHPEAFKIHSHLRSTVFEVKPYQVLKDNWATLKPKIKAVQASLEGTFVPFKVITERQLRPDFVRNVRFLLNYDQRHMIHKHKLTPRNCDLLSAVQQATPKDRLTTPRTILDSISKDPTERAYLVPWIWYGMRLQHVQADLIEPLSMDSEVWSMYMPHRIPKWMTKEYDWYR